MDMERQGVERLVEPGTYGILRHSNETRFLQEMHLLTLKGGIGE